jgi:hypothetical protein
LKQSHQLSIAASRVADTLLSPSAMTKLFISFLPMVLKSFDRDSQFNRQMSQETVLLQNCMHSNEISQERLQCSIIIVFFHIHLSTIDGII